MKIELKSMTYEECRTEHFKQLMKKMQRKIAWWKERENKLRPLDMASRSHIECSEAGMQYNFYKDALEALAAQPKWISVEEKLPGDPLDGVGDVVELLIDKGDVKEVLPGYYDHDEKDWIIYFGDPSGMYLSKCFSWWRVIKWRSLPEPPKEGV